MKGYKNGKGKEYDKNGNLKYDGHFKNNNYEGIGKLKLVLLGKEYNYEGGFINGKPHGSGILLYKDGKIRYIGLFAFGKINGRSELY